MTDEKDQLDNRIDRALDSYTPARRGLDWSSESWQR